MNVKVGPLLLLVLISSSIGYSQTAHKQSGSAAQASLTVTATIESSVWLIDPDGKREIVVANAPDPKASFSHARPEKKGAGAEQVAVRPIVKAKELAPHEEDAVQFNIPINSQHFDVTNKTVGTVVVTTVVAQ